jgi:tetratricopeptide (TPR) repeat protein
MKKILLSTLVASLLMTGSYAKETAAKGASVKQVNTIAVNNAKEDAKNHQVKLVQEAIDSLKYAHDALVALDKKDAKSAKDNLEKALGKLEVIMASEHAPKLLPIDNVITVQEFIGTSKDAEKAVVLAGTLLAAGKVQEAREILLPLKSEIDVTVVSLPLATYPDALKLAAKYVTDGKLDKAKEVLAVALSTFVEVTTVAPIPLLKAADLIAAAADIAATDTKKAKVYLEAAQDQLKLAQALGYVSKSDVTYKALNEAIDDIEDHIESKEIKEKFEALKAKLKDFTAKIFSAKDEAKKEAAKAANK